MPVFKQYTESSYKWGIWKTSESLEELLALLPHKEKYELSVYCLKTGITSLFLNPPVPVHLL